MWLAYQRAKAHTSLSHSFPRPTIVLTKTYIISRLGTEPTGRIARCRTIPAKTSLVHKPSPLPLYPTLTMPPPRAFLKRLQTTLSFLLINPLAEDNTLMGEGNEVMVYAPTMFRFHSIGENGRLCL